MAVVSKLKISGLRLADNEFSATPDGGLVEADNLVIRGKEIIEPRRGQFSRTYNTPSSVFTEEVFFHGDDILVKTPAGLLRDTGSEFEEYADDGTFGTSSSTTFEAPDQGLLRTKSAESGHNFYFTTDFGVYVVDGSVAESSGLPTARPAGCPKTPDTLVGQQLADPNGWIDEDVNVMYRLLVGKKDEHETLYLGSPCNPLTVRVTGDLFVSNVQLQFTPPRGSTVNHFWRLYRAKSAPYPTTPIDEMHLVKEAYFTESDLLAGEITYTDVTPDDLLAGSYLYTNANTGDGTVQSNDPPPYCKDIAYWNNRMMFANVKLRPTLLFTVISPFTAGDVIEVFSTFLDDSVSYVATVWSEGVQPEVPGHTLFNIPGVASSSGSVSTDIETGAVSLVTAINANTVSTGVHAYYLRGDTDTPGTIVLEAADIGNDFTVSYQPIVEEVTSLSRTSGVVTAVIPTSLASDEDFVQVGTSVTVEATSPSANFPNGTFTVLSVSFFDAEHISITYSQAGVNATHLTPDYTIRRVSTLTSFNPELYQVDVPSEDDAAPHRIYYSKLQQPENAPPLNFFDVGNPGKQILRIVPLKDKLFVFKPEGIFLVSGDAPFRVDLLDDTVRLIAPDSVVTCGGQIYGLTNQGVVAVGEGGVAIISSAIEPEITRLYEENLLAILKRSAFGVSHESDRLYSLWIPETTDSSDADAAICSKAFVYSTTSGVWTTWDLRRNCGRVDPNTDVLHMGKGLVSEVPTLVRERKAYTREDYHDEEIAAGTGVYVAATATSFGTFEFDATPADAVVGDILQDEAGGRVIVTEVLTAGQTVRVHVAPSSTWTGEGAITILKAYATALKWKAIDAGDPTSTKQFRDLSVHFRTRDPLYKFSMTYTTDQVPTPRTVDLVNRDYDPSETAELWGIHREPVLERMIVNQEHQRGTVLHVKIETQEACGMWALNGIAVSAEMNSERNKK